MKQITLTEEQRTLAKQVLEAAPLERGYQIADVKNALAAIASIDAAKDDIVTLEDAHYVFLKRRVEGQPWRVASPDIVAFVDAVCSTGD